MSGPLSRFHKIKKLEISGGGFLGGVTMDLADGLNCLIGGRGAGKTTSLEFLRYALAQMPDPRRHRARHEALGSLVEANLGAGQVAVEIETRDGLHYRVERAAGEEPIVLDADGQPTSLVLTGLFGAEVYSQNEIERIATSPSFQLDLIDKFREEELGEIQRKLLLLEGVLGNSGSEILSLEAQVEELESQLTELPLVTERLEKGFKVHGSDEGSEFEREVHHKGLRERECRSVQAGFKHFNAIRDSVEATVALCRRANERQDSSRLGAGPNQDVLARLDDAYGQTCDEVSALLSTALDRLGRGAGEVESFAAELEDAHRQQERGYQGLLRQHNEEQGQARERVKLQKRSADLLEKQRDLNARRQDLAAKRKKRRALVHGLKELWQSRTRLREDVVRFLNDRLSPEIRVSIDPASERSRYKQLLLDAFQGVGRPYKAPAEKVAKKLRPDALLEILEADDPIQLVERCGVSASQARWIVCRLQTSRARLELEAVELGDVPMIELWDGDYKAAPKLSTGQKCTTILPILLLDSEKPLLVDEPEGNLDNAFIYNTVVKKIRRAKESRQLIFVTHNPNIPVLGEADRVIVLTSDGAHARVAAAGTVDDVKEEVETILEGGREAFEERRRRYGR
ncbi:MAG: AAA family ATPase [Planctomycetes bacterium]|nr:AAA family ATPase [Planctomycetota bacterium]